MDLTKQVGGGHYQKYKIQPIELILQLGLDFPAGNIIKYFMRWEDKNGIEDLNKIKQYLEFIWDDTTGFEHIKNSQILTELHLKDFIEKNKLNRLQALFLSNFIYFLYEKQISFNGKADLTNQYRDLVNYINDLILNEQTKFKNLQ